MKKLLLSLSLLISLGSQAQTATSTVAGAWLNPTTWNCGCVPISGYSVTINHSVTLNTSMTFTTGGVTIGNNGSLVQDANRDILISGGYFYNNGNANFRFMLVTAGTASNSGTFSLAAFSNSAASTFTNNGSFTLDSMSTAAGYTNSTLGVINGNRFTNSSAGFLNVGRITFSLALNTGTFINGHYQAGYAFTNSGIYSNFDSLMLSYSLWNKGKFTNNSNSLVKLTKRLHNTVPAGTAVFDNNGTVMVLDSWYNTDTVKGTNTGTFTIADTSANSGFMKGNFKFCDQTPAFTPPYVDLNSGTIGNGITWCTISGINEKENFSSFMLYPNPNNGTFYISSGSETELSIYDVNGRMISELKLEAQNSLKTSFTLNEGIYFVKGEGVMKKLVVIR
jgi:hypothetical protein